MDLINTANIKNEENQVEEQIAFAEFAYLNDDEESCSTCEDDELCDCVRCKSRINTDFDEENFLFVENFSEKDDDDVVNIEEIPIKKEVIIKEDNGISIENPSERTVEGNF